MCRAPAISPLVSLRFLLSMLIATTMAFAPFAMQMGEAMATQPAHHEAMAGMAMDDHCAGDQKQQKDTEKGQKSCCVAGCFAVASLNAPAKGDVVRRIAVERPEREQFKRGILGEIATPPPRLS